MRFGRRIHQLADLHQALTLLDPLDGDGDQRLGVSAIGVAVDTLRYFHAAQARAVLLAGDLEDGLLLIGRKARKIDGAELVRGFPSL